MAQRASQGGHDVPTDKLNSRFPRILANLKAALRGLPNVLVYDNSNLADPYRLLVAVRNGKRVFEAQDLPPWARRAV